MENKIQLGAISALRGKVKGAAGTWECHPNMTQRVREGFFLEEIPRLEQNIICLLMFYSPVVCEPLDDKHYIFVRRSIR